MTDAAPRTDKRREIEANVLRATEELLAGGSRYADLGVEKIATRAGISRTAFYFYFRDKRDLLMALTTEVNQQLYVEADSWWSGDAPVAEALQRVGQMYADHGPLLRAIVEVSTYDEEVARFWRSLIGRFVDATEGRLANAGHTRPRPTAFALVWMTERVYYEQLVQGSPIDGDELLAGITGIWEAVTA